MKTINDFDAKRRKYMPTFPIAKGKPTVYIEGYPYEDDGSMGPTGIHVQRMAILFDQLIRYYIDEPNVYVGMDNFVYYCKGDVTKYVVPDIFIVFGVSKIPLRYSFYTWAEGASPVAVFEFLDYSTAEIERVEKCHIYLSEMGVQEYYVHQPDLEQAVEFHGIRLLRPYLPDGTPLTTSVEEARLRIRAEAGAAAMKAAAEERRI